eukprot:Protomagalhaensia_sp_Gyna_25__5980@NODE_929_length_2402_cov_13_122725_g735_i0_p2_GENE_NODE_929_length_2402_cov_13_122725_g735_i0NODE_929_length_2402_cov_13_122725_g735_i0_p2_ORF_typecomplete_len270_score31_10RRM_1/PF00076_22/6e08RRM_1/PF00076_22/9_7e03RRM_3/PF08777_11/1_7e06Limkainb1/PF11608_8/0_0007RRM_5/PF13893_6/0_0021DNA_pol3_a_NII/PF11490_8/0_011DUF2606/PF10794_9/0_039RRM_occluded/PF16842_5/0_052Btz/PF09405_10/0_26Btz/PF09405_10/2_7e02_NODE_929_length_2402_cov_13_122725_g735_i089811
MAGGGDIAGVRHGDGSLEEPRRGGPSSSYSTGSYRPTRFVSGGGGRRPGRPSERYYSPASRRVAVGDGPYRQRSVDAVTRSTKSWRHDRFEGNVSVPASTVFIRGLTKDVSDNKLRALFQDVGCEVCMLKIERAPLTTAVVGFTRRDAAAKAVEKVHNTHFMGEPIRVMIWERDEEALRRAVQQRQQQEREEDEQIRQELEAMQNSDIEGKLKWAKNQGSKHQVTLASQTPKRSVFERVS